MPSAELPAHPLLHHRRHQQRQLYYRNAALQHQTRNKPCHQLCPSVCVCLMSAWQAVCPNNATEPHHPQTLFWTALAKPANSSGLCWHSGKKGKPNHFLLKTARSLHQHCGARHHEQQHYNTFLSLNHRRCHQHHRHDHQKRLFFNNK